MTHLRCHRVPEMERSSKEALCDVGEVLGAPGKVAEAVMRFVVVADPWYQCVLIITVFLSCEIPLTSRNLKRAAFPSSGSGHVVGQ